MKTDVAIIGAGPAGLLLGHLLCAAGISTTIVERQSATHVLSRIRAGVLEATTTDLMRQLGLDQRLNAEGLWHEGFHLSSSVHSIRIDIAALTGKHVTVYGQTEVTRDLMDAAPERGLEVIYEAADVALHEIESNAPWIGFTKDGQHERLEHVSLSAATAFMARRDAQFLRARFSYTTRFTRSAGLASLPTYRHAIRNSFTPITSTVSRLHPCARPRGAAIIFRYRWMRKWKTGLMTVFGTSSP